MISPQTVITDVIAVFPYALPQFWLCGGTRADYMLLFKFKRLQRVPFCTKTAYIFAPAFFPPLPVKCSIFSLYTVTGNEFSRLHLMLTGDPDQSVQFFRYRYFFRQKTLFFILICPRFSKKKLPFIILNSIIGIRLKFPF